MLKYRARIPLKKEEAHVLPKMFREWAHYRIEASQMPLEEIRLSQEKVYASRFVRPDSTGAVWKTDLVYSEETGIANVFLAKTYHKGSRESNFFKTPRIVDQLYTIADTDHGIPTTLEPIILSDLNMNIVKALVTGELNSVMPVIYVSTQNSTMITDPGHMAEALKGIAHVIVSFNPDEDRMIFKETGSRSVPINGRVSVFLPGEKHPTIYAPTAFSSNRAFEHELIRMISSYSMQTTHEAVETWEDVLRIKAKESRETDNAVVQKQTETAKKKIADIANRNTELTDAKKKEKFSSEKDEKLKKLQAENTLLKSNNHELEELIDSEIDRLQAKLDERNKQYELLQAENMNVLRENETMKARISESIKQPVLFHGTEKDYYPDEAKEVILDALEKQMSALGESREKDVLDDILANNPSSGTRQEMHETVKSMFSGYKGMTDKLENDLHAIGISVSHSKHEKLQLKGDSRYILPVSSTPSDRHSGNSAAREINKKFF